MLAVLRYVGLAVSMVAGLPAFGQSYTLTEAPREGECFRLRIETQLTGTLKVNRDGKAATIKIGAHNEHQYAERVLAARNGVIRKAARNYSTAVSRATVDDQPLQRTLAPEHRLIVAQRTSDVLFCYTPAGPLTRTELEVVSEHFETLHLTGLLPTKPVIVGESWKLDSAVAQSLCLFEGLIAHDLSGKLTDVTGSVASVSVAGTAKGIENGALANLSVAATVRYDLAHKRITKLEWKQKDVRDQGPVSPAAEIDTTTTLNRELLDREPPELTAALARIPATDDPPLTLKHLIQSDAKGRYQFAHGRDWHVVAQTDHHLVMRLLERGDFVAQATLTVWQPAGAGKHLTPEEFEKLVSVGTGWKLDEVLDRQEVPTGAGRWVFRITARGTLDGTPVVQAFYVVATAEGEQMIVTFTTRPAAAGRLGTRDLEIVNGIVFGRK